jgi:hypothetical protein
VGDEVLKKFSRFHYPRMEKTQGHFKLTVGWALSFITFESGFGSPIFESGFWSLSSYLKEGIWLSFITLESGFALFEGGFGSLRSYFQDWIWLSSLRVDGLNCLCLPAKFWYATREVSGKAIVQKYTCLLSGPIERGTSVREL